MNLLKQTITFSQAIYFFLIKWNVQTKLLPIHFCRQTIPIKIVVSLCLAFLWKQQKQQNKRKTHTHKHTNFVQCFVSLFRILTGAQEGFQIWVYHSIPFRVRERWKCCIERERKREKSITKKKRKPRFVYKRIDSYLDDVLLCYYKLDSVPTQKATIEWHKSQQGNATHKSCVSKKRKKKKHTCGHEIPNGKTAYKAKHTG